MDWADDITYSVHDLEDFYRAGRIPLSLLAAKDDSERNHFFKDVFMRAEVESDSYILEHRGELETGLKDLLLGSFPILTPYRGTDRQRANLRNFTGILIDRYVRAVTLKQEGASLIASIDPQFRHEVAMLKQLTWTYVIQDSALTTQQVGQKRMIRALFEVYSSASQNPHEWKIFPGYYQDRLREAAIKRTSCEFARI